MIRTLSALTLASALLMPLNSLTAQDSDKWIPKGWEISPFIGVFDDMPEFDPGRGEAPCSWIRPRTCSPEPTCRTT